MSKNKTTEDYSILITDDKLLSKYSHNQLNVLGYLQFKREYYTDYRASHNDFFYVTIDEIRDKTGIKSRDTITLFNRLFLQDGIIDYKSGGKHTPNHYRLNWDIESVDLHNEEADFNHVETPKSDTSIKNEEVKNVLARFEQDATGRLINVTLHPGEEDQVTYAVTTNTITDQAKYDDAMNQYEYDKAKYDQAIQEINAKIAIIQNEYKNI